MVWRKRGGICGFEGNETASSSGSLLWFVRFHMYAQFRRRGWLDHSNPFGRPRHCGHLEDVGVVNGSYLFFSCGRKLLHPVSQGFLPSVHNSNSKRQIGVSCGTENWAVTKSESLKRSMIFAVSSVLQIQF